MTAAVLWPERRVDRGGQPVSVQLSAVPHGPSALANPGQEMHAQSIAAPRRQFGPDSRLIGKDVRGNHSMPIEGAIRHRKLQQVLMLGRPLPHRQQSCQRW